MSHRHAPLTPAGRLRLIDRCLDRPLAHIAAGAGGSRQCLSKWKGRYARFGEAGLQDRSSAPARPPHQIPDEVVARIDALRRERKWSAAKIGTGLDLEGTPVSIRRVGRWLERLGINQRKHLDVDGEDLRRSGKIEGRFAGHMVHLDVKKVGRIPDGGGWRVHGKGSLQHKESQQGRRRGFRAGYTYLHFAVDGFSRLAHTPAAG